MRATTQRMLLAGAAGLVAVALVACDATETNPVMEDEGPPNPATANSETAPPTVAPPSGVEIGEESGTAANAWTPPEDPKQTQFLGLLADKPVTWIEHPGATSMELARFTVPGRDGTSAAEIVVFYFGPGQGGSVDANIQRWQNQFRPNEDGTPVEPDVTTIMAGDDIEITLVELLGDWQSRGAASYTADQQFITAIVDCPRGPLFIRFVGDRATVAPNRNAFIDMMRSLRLEQEE